MSYKTPSLRGRLALLAIVVVAVVLLLPAAALAATPSVTIVGPENISMTPPPTAAAPAVNDVWVTLYLQDNGSGANMYRLSNDAGGTWSSGYSLTTEAYDDWYMWDDLTDATLLLDGPHTVTAQFSNDGGTTWGPTASATTMIDLQPPEMTAPDGYWNSRYPYKLTAHDQIGLSGVQYLWYRVDSGAFTKVTNASPVFTADPLAAMFALPGETGTPHTIDSIATDYAGNYSGYYQLVKTRAARVARGDIRPYVYAHSVYVVVDKTAPKAKAMGARKGWHSGPVTISFSATDGTSGVNRIEYSITRLKAKKHGYWTAASSVVVTQAGRHKVWYRAVDNAQPKGNASSPKYLVVKIH